MDLEDQEALWTEFETLADEIVAVGRDSNLPFIAAASDIGDPNPLRDHAGNVLAETRFKWLDPTLEYWKDPAFALRSAFVMAVRHCSEPFYYADKLFGSWRRNFALEAINQQAEIDALGVATAIICPCYSPRGVVGAVVWASDAADVNVAEVFRQRATELHVLTMKFISTYRDVHAGAQAAKLVDLTRREVVCLKWAAAGKTDAEIATIIGVSQPTVRFHLTNAFRKLGVSGRSQAVRLATNLGYIGEASP